MEPVSHLDSVRCTSSGALHILYAAVTADHFDTRMVEQPLSKCISGALGEQIHGRMTLEVNKNSAVHMPFAERKVVHAQHAWSRPWCWRLATSEAQEGVGADRHTLSLGKAGTGLSANLKTNPALLSTQPVCPASVWCDETWQAFAKGAAWAS